MQLTSIEWTDMSWNPIRARRREGGQRVPGHYCEKISSGCAHCYASRTQPRFGMPQFPGERAGAGGPDVEAFLDEDALNDMLRSRKAGGKKVFVCDMSDLFGRWVPDEWIDLIFAVMALCPQHTFQILTKRPERMADFMASVSDVRLANAANTITRKRGGSLPRGNGDRIFQWPPRNCWLGTSIENQVTADERTHHLLHCPAAVRFLSAEPLLGPIDLRLLPGEADCVQWCIVGGESGPGARPMHPDWARSLRDQCQAAGVSFFFKQWGAWMPGTIGGGCDRHVRVMYHDGRLADPNLDPDAHLNVSLPWVMRPNRDAGGHVMSKVGKKSAGRLLDGREWNEMPAVSGTLPGVGAEVATT